MSILFKRQQTIARPFASTISRQNSSPTFKFFRRDTYSGATFDAATSPFPSNSELHGKDPPSNELIRYMRRWDDELRLDAKSAEPRWTPQQRLVMMAACVRFRLVHDLNKEWCEERLKEALTRWDAVMRRGFARRIRKERNGLAADVAARKKKAGEDWFPDFGGFWGKVKLALVIILTFLVTWEVLETVVFSRGARIWESSRSASSHPPRWNREYDSGACSGMAVQTSPVSAAHSGGINKPPVSTCILLW